MAHITKIRVANTSRTVEAEVYPCKFEDMVAWQRRIHRPFIKPLQCIGNNWDWPALFIGCHIVEQMFSRQAIAFQIRVADPVGDAVPVAQAILSLPYAWPADQKHQCVFLWFVAATPETALKALNVTDRFAVLPAVLDVAVQVSLSNGLEGRIGLHAAPSKDTNESNELLQRYQRLGLRSRNKQASKYFKFPSRPDDGRLFYFDPEDALVFAKKQDDLR